MGMSSRNGTVNVRDLAKFRKGPGRGLVMQWWGRRAEGAHVKRSARMLNREADKSHLLDPLEC